MNSPGPIDESESRSRGEPSTARGAPDLDTARARKRRVIVEGDSSNEEGTIPDHPGSILTIEGFASQPAIQSSQESAPSPQSWSKFYRLKLGKLPPIAACTEAGGTEKYLAEIPIRSIGPNGALAHHFFPEAKGDVKVFCRVILADGQQCPKEFEATTGTGTRLRHVKNDHASIYNALHQFRDRQKNYIRNNRQPTLAETQRRAENAPLSENMQLRFRMQLARMLATSLVPLSFVENPEFRQLIKIANPKFVVPVRATVRNDLGVLRATLANEVEDRLKSCSFGSFTADTWTSHANHKFLGVTFHWISRDFEPLQITIGMESINEKQRAVVLKDKLATVIERWKLGPKLLSGTTDSGSNIKSAMQQLSGQYGLQWLPCSAHTIQLCINAALVEVKAADRVLTKCHDLAVQVRNSSLIRRYLDAIQIERDPTTRPLTFLIDMPTRWSSQFLMVQRLLKLWEEVKETIQRIAEEESGHDATRQARRLEDNLLTAGELHIARELITILEPLHHFTNQIGSTKFPAISKVYPLIWDMLHGQGINPNLITEAAQSVRRVLREQIQRRWPMDRIPDEALIATFLNPAARHHPLLHTRQERGGINDLLTTHAQSLIVQKLLAGRSGGTGKADSSDGDVPQAGPAPQAPSAKIKGELLLYCLHSFNDDERRQKYFDNPLAWWSKHRLEFHHLSLLARQYHAIQATSVPSERLFSASGNIVTKKRSNLNATTIENLLFIRQFVQAFDNSHEDSEDSEDEDEL